MTGTPTVPAHLTPDHWAQATRLLIRKSLKLLRDKQLWFRVGRKHSLIPI